jgi:AraC family transcriptional regulator
MSLTQQALWMLERNSATNLELDDVASACGVSRFHLAHAFARRTGRPLISYLRGRRLSAAAIELANGREDILNLALESGYGSHEAFSRAFKSQFNVTPESVRAAASTEHLELVTLPKLDESASRPSIAPRSARAQASVAIGEWGKIPIGDTTIAAGMWQSFMSRAHLIDAARQMIPIGLSRSSGDPDVVDYACAIETDQARNFPKGMVRIGLPARTYAVFEHTGHVSAIAATYTAIWDAWSVAEQLPIEAYGLCIERHKPTFNPMTGLGGIEIWMPLQEI